MPLISLIVTAEYEGLRIDKYLTEVLSDLSRSYIQKQIENGGLTVNEKASKSNYKIKTEDEISFNIPESVIPDINPENIPIEIVYEDEDVCIVNKPQGMVVHPAPGHYSGTLVNALMFHLDGRLSGINGVLRPGIVHRIDKDTSGLLMVCKNDFSHIKISNQLKDHSCERVYHAIIHGCPEKDEFVIDKPIGRSDKDRRKMSVREDGKRAVTHVKVLNRFKNFSYIECKLETGRTHQIRVHLSYLGYPILGDPVYCNIKESIKTNGQTLHAKTIGFLSPSTGERKFFDSELPEYFKKLLNYIESQ